MNNSELNNYVSILMKKIRGFEFAQHMELQFCRFLLPVFCTILVERSLSLGYVLYRADKAIHSLRATSVVFLFSLLLLFSVFFFLLSSQVFLCHWMSQMPSLCLCLSMFLLFVSFHSEDVNTAHFLVMFVLLCVAVVFLGSYYIRMIYIVRCHFWQQFCCNICLFISMFLFYSLIG